jgi:hypothetical protein
MAGPVAGADPPRGVGVQPTGYSAYALRCEEGDYQSFKLARLQPR